MTINNYRFDYIAPSIDVIDVAVEQGFILSSPDFTGTTPSSDDEE